MPQAKDGRKVCSVCREDKDVSNFYRCRSNKDGLQYRCKPCQDEAAAGKRSPRATRYDPKTNTKACARCRDRKPVSEFTSSPSQSGGVGAYCRRCARAVTREYRANNAERLNEWRRKHYQQRKEDLIEYRRQRHWAHDAVARAIANGTLVRPTECPRCGTATRRIEGHHPDYRKALDVVWLCALCHKREHRR